MIEAISESTSISILLPISISPLKEPLKRNLGLVLGSSLSSAQRPMLLLGGSHAGFSPSAWPS